MSYEGQGEDSAVFRAAADVSTLAMKSGSVARYVARGAETGGRYGLFRWELRPRGAGPALHFHRTFSEAFYILEGTVRLLTPQQGIDARPGDFLFVPEGGQHGFRNESDEPAAMLILFAPGTPRERYFEEVDEIARSGRELSAEEWTELLARHDQYMV